MPPTRLRSVSKFVWNIMSKCSLEPRNVALPYPIRRQLKVGVCVKAWVLAAGWVPVGEWVVVVEVADRK
jgi:hypothetical protein